MIKILKSNKIKNIEERATSGESPVTKMENLMENAGAALFIELKSKLTENSRVSILCGKGNNGGDGFVLARLLGDIGVFPKVILPCGESGTGLAAQAFSKLKNKFPKDIEIISADKTERISAVLEESDIIVDAVFGFGFKGELRGKVKEIIALANACKAYKISADIPSGAECDSARISKETFKADCTVTFNCMKPATVSYPAKELCGEIVVANVGIPDELLENQSSDIIQADMGYLREKLQKIGRKKVQSNKGTRGRLLCVCGSYGMAGACIMAASAALRCGIGLLDIAVDKRIYPIVAQMIPEAIFTVIDQKNPSQADFEKLRDSLQKADGCIMGCGLGSENDELVGFVIENCEVPVLLDADAINSIAREPKLIEKLTAPWVMTPHPGEMARLVGKNIPEIQAGRIEAAESFARIHGGVLLLKGAGTVIAGKDSLAVNPTGNPGMAKGGSGDVLSGIIGAFMAQGLEAFDAATVGAFVHGMAGDFCQKRLGEIFMQPTDMINTLKDIFAELNL